jgi:hypothetical protein
MPFVDSILEARSPRPQRHCSPLAISRSESTRDRPRFDVSHARIGAAAPITGRSVLNVGDRVLHELLAPERQRQHARMIDAIDQVCELIQTLRRRSPQIDA